MAGPKQDSKEDPKQDPKAQSHERWTERVKRSLQRETTLNKQTEGMSPSVQKTATEGWMIIQTKTVIQTGWRFRQNKKQIQQEKNPVKQQKCATASPSVAENQISNPSRVESWSKCYHRILHLPVPVARANVQSGTAQKVSETPPARKGGLIQPRDRWWIRRNISYELRER